MFLMIHQKHQAPVLTATSISAASQYTPVFDVASTFLKFRNIAGVSGTRFLWAPSRLRRLVNIPSLCLHLCLYPQERAVRLGD